jgi:hypothetical protein
MRRVLTPGSIDGRLTVDGQEPELVHLGKLLVDDRGLLRRGLTGPRKCSQFVTTEFGKQRSDVREPMRGTKRSVSKEVRPARTRLYTDCLGSPHNSNASFPWTIKPHQYSVDMKNETQA